MKYHISISKREILTAIILIIGFMLLFKGIHSCYKMNHALSLDTLDGHELREGTYVTGDIDTYIGQIMYGSNRFYGVSQGWVTLGKTYEFYTVPIKSGSYIALMISDESVKEKLDAFNNGHGEGVYFEGIIIEPPVELNYPWYDDLEGFSTEDLIDSVVIQETNLKKKNTTYPGLLFMVIASLLFFSSGGIKNIVVKETDHTRPVYNNYNNHEKIYNTDYELQAAKKQLETLERRFRSVKRNAILCLLLLLIGIYIVYSAYLLGGKLFGVLLLIISVRGIWNYFINSANTLAKSLAGRFAFESLSIQIEEHKNNIKRHTNCFVDSENFRF